MILLLTDKCSLKKIKERNDDHLSNKILCLSTYLPFLVLIIAFCNPICLLVSHSTFSIYCKTYLLAPDSLSFCLSEICQIQNSQLTDHVCVRMHMHALNISL